MSLLERETKPRSLPSGFGVVPEAEATESPDADEGVHFPPFPALESGTVDEVLGGMLLAILPRLSVLPTAMNKVRSWNDCDTVGHQQEEGNPWGPFGNLLDFRAVNRAQSSKDCTS
jgi:hypothetical protein